MDRSLLERMTGATVLVILLVVLAPALLDGRQSPGGAEYAAETDIIDAPDSDAPMRVATIQLRERSTVEAEVPPAKPKPRAKPAAPVQRSAPSVPAAQAEQWMVQLGSFSGQKNAAAYADKVKAAGFPAVVTSFRSGGKTMYRVQVGPRESRASADQLVRDLKKAGYKALVMPAAS